MIYIAENLKRFRRTHELTQEEVALAIGVSPQSVSKWEREESYPDITLLPALAQYFHTSIDALMGMERIQSKDEKHRVYEQGHMLLKEGNYGGAVDVFREALKNHPNDAGIMSELAMALAFSDTKEDLLKAISLCEKVLNIEGGQKVDHTTRAALCFIYLKTGQKERAIQIAGLLPHIRECREEVLGKILQNPNKREIEEYMKYLAIGEV